MKTNDYACTDYRDFHVFHVLSQLDDAARPAESQIEGDEAEDNDVRPAYSSDH